MWGAILGQSKCRGPFGPCLIQLLLKGCHSWKSQLSVWLAVRTCPLNVVVLLVVVVVGCVVVVAVVVVVGGGGGGGGVVSWGCD